MQHSTCMLVLNCPPADGSACLIRLPYWMLVRHRLSHQDPGLKDARDASAPMPKISQDDSAWLCHNTGTQMPKPCHLEQSLTRYRHAGATITGGTVTVEGCGSESLQGDVRFAEVMGLMGADVEWSPYSIKITGTPSVSCCIVDSRSQLKCASQSYAVVCQACLLISACEASL